MKKIIGLLMLALMLFCFVSCDIAKPAEKEEDTTFTGTVYIRRFGSKEDLGSTSKLPDAYDTWSDLQSSDGMLMEGISVPGLPDKLDFIDAYGTNVKLVADWPGTSSIDVYNAQHEPIPVDSPLLKYIYIDFE